MKFDAESARLRHEIFEVSADHFEELTLQVFRFQYEFNDVYRSYCDLLGRVAANIHSLTDIPFLPIEIFKTQQVITGDLLPEKIFRSSGTTGQVTSQHFVCDLGLYEESVLRGFRFAFGEPGDYCLLALLPSYLERNDASLVYMMKHLMDVSRYPVNNSFKTNLHELHKSLMWLEEKNQHTILLGVTFGLLDFASQFPMPLPNTIIIETGGMKGRREEMTRNELHDLLGKAFQPKKIMSEYGMTEMLSQAYSDHEKFRCPPWMKILIRNATDPFEIIPDNQVGALNVIDLANLFSCAFIATADLGIKFDDERFEVRGRMEESDVRGCNLMW